jgi:predicted ATPase/DNA-binding SARP family transcriptional activator
VDDRVATPLCVLGSLEFVRDGEPLQLGSPQQRRLLAVLLVHANDVVSSDRLVDVLWAEDPPRSATHALQTLLSRLRASLGQGRLETRPPGYRLQVASGEVDASRFEELVRAGLGVAERPEVALEVFDEALGLWRGLPYAEFADEEFATAEVARLVELRARAIEERSAALLALGRAEDVIGELEAEIALQPFRERLRALLMLALARAGRPVESLRAYDAYRRFLADEIGVIPSPGLQELNDDIVRQHPDVGWAASPRKDPDTATLPSGTVPFVAFSGNNLPAPVDSFVGRRTELAAVLDALRESRLVTLTGPGGSGKTRLALEAATTALSSFRNGVWFVSLAVAENGERVVPLVAAELGVPELANEPVADTLEQGLRDRELLLVLDNCEQIVSAVAAFAERYLAGCPSVRILATSREFLAVRGERALSTPPLDVADDLALARESDAVELFMVRASAAAPGFDADAADVATVAQICRRVDGLPLSIELAAARLRALSLEQIATRLDDRFRLLRGGERTLEAVVAWSYDLLTDAERELFVRLAAFPGDFSLEAAEMVVSDAIVAEDDILDLLTRLVEKSLVMTVISDDRYRYRLLETLREYARARLDERGEGERWHHRLLAWAMTRVEDVEASLRRPGQDATLSSVRADAVTLRAAMDWADTNGDQLAALRIASAVPIGLVGERRQTITSLLEQLGPGVEPQFAGHAYSALGNLAFEQGDWAASSEAHTKAAEQFLLAGSAWDAAWATYSGVQGAWGAGDLARAETLVRQAIDRFRSDRNEMGLGYALSDAALLTTDLDEAQRLAAEADKLLGETGAPIAIAHNVERRGIIAYDLDELADAAAFVAEAVEVFSRYGNLGCCAHALESAAVIVGQAGQPETATELLGAAEQLRHRSGQGHKPWEIRARHGDIEDRIAPVSPAVHEAALNKGRQHSLESAARAAFDALSITAQK